MSGNEEYPPYCECGGKIVTEDHPELTDTDGDNPPGLVHLNGVCEDCGKKYNLMYQFCECGCHECMNDPCTCKEGKKRVGRPQKA